MTDLTELRRLLEAATPGEWYVYTDKLRPRFPARIIEIHNNDGVVLAWPGFDSAPGTHDEKIAKAGLICAAVNALPALLEVAEAALTEAS